MRQRRGGRTEDDAEDKPRRRLPCHVLRSEVFIGPEIDSTPEMVVEIFKDTALNYRFDLVVFLIEIELFFRLSESIPSVNRKRPHRRLWRHSLLKKRTWGTIFGATHFSASPFDDDLTNGFFESLAIVACSGKDQFVRRNLLFERGRSLCPGDALTIDCQVRIKFNFVRLNRGCLNRET